MGMIPAVANGVGQRGKAFPQGRTLGTLHEKSVRCTSGQASEIERNLITEKNKYPESLLSTRRDAFFYCSIILPVRVVRLQVQGGPMTVAGAGIGRFQASLSNCFVIGAISIPPTTAASSAWTRCVSRGCGS